jgi:FAD/FMN-containing dehydrogenase
MPDSAVTDELLATLKERLGPSGFIDDKDTLAPYLVDARQLYQGSAPAVLRPANVDEVAFAVTVCAENNVALVPQGGNTGYMGGAVPGLTKHALPISLGRMNRIRAVDPIDYSMVAEAGCVLADLQAAAADRDRLFPLSLAAEGSCQIGGNLATNAGGVQVLRYGNARDLVLGLEVVLPDGNIWHGLRNLRKDNTGYDLKQLFLGSEGTLGIITAASLKLFPAARATCTFVAAVSEPAAATALLARLRTASSDSVTSFEYMHRDCIDLVLEHIEAAREPFNTRHEHYALVELTSGTSSEALTELVEAALADSFKSGETLDGVIASSLEQAKGLWRLRETIPEAQKHAGGCIKHDVSVQVSRVPEFLERATVLARETLPGVRIIPFGHMGDGNIHFNLTQPHEASAQSFVDLTGTITPVIHDLIAEMDGSFSAEHGIGRLKREDLKRYRPMLDLDLMGKVKAALDPDNLMNPGVIL